MRLYETARSLWHLTKSIAPRRLSARNQYAGLNPNKLELIDLAFRTLPVRSFADLGGLWGVDAGYTFYALEHHAPTTGV